MLPELIQLMKTEEKYKHEITRHQSSRLSTPTDCSQKYKRMRQSSGQAVVALLDQENYLRKEERQRQKKKKG